MEAINFDYSKAVNFFKKAEMDNLSPFAKIALHNLKEKEGVGAEFTDWVDWPKDFLQSEIERINQTAQKIRENSDVLVVIGIGGSYLGAKAAIDFLNHSFYNLLAPSQGFPQIFFAGNNISSTYLNDLIEVIGERDFSINVISKSGTTTEPAIAFRILKEKMIDKYGKEEAYQRIFATTDQSKGALKKEADENNYESFVIPDGIGGRFSVLTPVGLLPIAVSGAHIEKILQGARFARENYLVDDLENNQAMQYAVLRNIFYRKGKVNELLVNYEPNLNAFGEWWKQLFGESEGKDQKGIFPCSANFSTDLHSIGQIIQDGQRNLFETVLNIQTARKEIEIPRLEENIDGLSYLEGEMMSSVNQMAYKGTMIAHTDGSVPNLIIDLPAMNEETLGQLIYFFEMAVSLSGYLNGVNPFDQPGVEAYKRNMFALLGKPGYEDISKELSQRI
ncbi:glucose-6-phosphate isomerase [Facklamia miroungae]|uniref:Glucose-6-phosphate isomerase n=1 Tax=Facklamia miroungae TaxID=120956 RepID=A0A1G7U6J2_9LACT|nr:glucose-6-phosphate isomerase [Facklamia miroungae]NKZ29935.1 glucose-6-phosphate isomerase [Facklamia miroungae]SDG43186.1 glucose-6-phosphate isomerase [Facklamia miroungae]